MELIKCMLWVICGIVGAIIYYKKFNEDKNIDVEALIFLWGAIGLFFVIFLYYYKKLNK